VQVFVSLHSGPATVLADEALLKQAFLNIMLNAVEAMPTGGDLSISTRLVDSAERPGDAGGRRSDRAAGIRNGIGRRRRPGRRRCHRFAGETEPRA
jgi:signal transduction histidine kinase